MINFEKNASDPKRLFQASFQLLQEERWRNSCFPNLLQLDDALFKAVREFEYVSGKPFIYGQRRYLDTLVCFFFFYFPMERVISFFVF